jgi:hypothetical protein
MGWFFAWIAFGMLTAYEVGELASFGDTEVGLVLALLCSVGGVVALFAIVVGAVRRHAPGQVLPVMLLSGTWLAVCVWWLYGPGHKPLAVPMFVAGALFFAFSFCVAFIGLLIAWRRHAAFLARRAQALADSARRSQLPRTRDGSPPPAFDHGGYPTGQKQ